MDKDKDFEGNKSPAENIFDDYKKKNFNFNYSIFQKENFDEDEKENNNGKDISKEKEIIENKKILEAKTLSTKNIRKSFEPKFNYLC